MKKPVPVFLLAKGMVIVFALLVLLVGTVVLAAWVQILATRALASEQAIAAQQRRIALGNGRALARQFILERMPSGAITITNANGAVSGGWGGFSLAGASSSYWTTTNLVWGNYFSPMNNLSYAVTFNGTITANGTSEPWRFRVRSRNPLIAGYPLVIHNNADTNVGSLSPTPAAAIYWTNVVGFPDLPTVSMSSGTNASGAGTNGFLGYFGAPMMTNVTATVISHSGYTNAEYVNATNNSIELFVNTTNNSSVVRYTVQNVIQGSGNAGGQQLFTNNAGTTIWTNMPHRVTSIRIIGSNATNILQVVVPAATTNLANMVLSGDNFRRMNFYRVGGSLTVQTTGVTLPWRMTMTMSNAPLAVVAPVGGLTIQGGIRTDSSLTVSGTTLSLVRDPAPMPDLLEATTDRILWLEDNRAP